MLRRDYPINRLSHCLHKGNKELCRSISCSNITNNNRKTYEIISEDKYKNANKVLNNSEHFASFSTMDGSFKCNNNNQFNNNNEAQCLKEQFVIDQLNKKVNTSQDISIQNLNVLNMRYIDIGSNNYFLACRPRFDNVIKYNKRVQDYYKGIPLSKGNKGWSIGTVDKIYKLRKQFNHLINNNNPTYK
jgi:hypothetical protein